jgi:HD-GYP domain-containing protein (c-di-GMP phosphodiesterase class II)
MNGPQEVALSEVLGALSYALDITEGEEPGHAVRTLAIGMRLAQQAGLPEEDRSALFYALLLKDAGCSANASRVSSLFAADDRQFKRAAKRADMSSPRRVALQMSRGAVPGGSPLAKARRLAAVAREGDVATELYGARCERGADIASSLDLPDRTAEAIRHLDEHWDGSGWPDGLRGEDIPLLSRVLNLAQTVEVHVRGGGVAAAHAVVGRSRGVVFDPALVDALRAFRDDAAFWGPLEDPGHVPAPARWEPAERVLVADDRRLDRVAEAFARVIDAKSPSTALHSTGVAAYAAGIAAVMGAGEAERRDLWRAGLLHDIGKLAVSNLILDKPGRLTDGEMAAMREHPRHTLQILERAACFRPLAAVAAAHHERLDGSGYHLGLGAAQLSRPARILAVADVYEALTADRSYRAAMTPPEALGVIGRQRGTHLCPESVDALVVAVGEGPRFTAGLAAPGAATPRPASPPARRLP